MQAFRIVFDQAIVCVITFFLSDKKDPNPSKAKQNTLPSQAKQEQKGPSQVELESLSPNYPRSKMGRKLFPSASRLRRRRSRSPAHSMANNEAGTNDAGEFESTASLSSSGRNPSTFNGISPNADNNATSMHAIQLQQMQLLMAAIQKLSDAVETNTSAIRDMQQQNDQQRHESIPSQRNKNNNNSMRLRTSPPNEHNTRSDPFDLFIPSPSDQRSSSLDSCSSSSSSEASSPDEGLERKQTRLDGLEVYAVVSAVTAGTLVAVFDSYHPGDILDLIAMGRWLELCLSLLFTATGAFGIVCGLHCIFVFSLITMYGRTALGMERDDALEIFFSGTGLQRYHGFKTFVASLYSLGTCLLVVIAGKISSNPSIHLFALMVSAKLMHYVYRDTQDIMDSASVIFAPPKLQELSMVDVEEAFDSANLDTFANQENSVRQQVVASTDKHPFLPQNDMKIDDNKDPQDDATKSQSATTNTSSKKDKQNRSRRRRSSLGLSAAEHIAIEEQKYATKKRASAMTLSATDLMGTNVGISRSCSMAVAPDQKTHEKRGEAATHTIENSDHSNKRDGEESTGHTAISSVGGTCTDIHSLVQQKNFRSVWEAAAQEVLVTASSNNEKGTNQKRNATDRGDDDDNPNADDGSDTSADAKRLKTLLASKQEGWQQQAWFAVAKAAAYHNQYHHHHGQHHGQHHGKRNSSAMHQSAMEQMNNIDAAGASTRHLFGGVQERRVSNSSRAA